MRQPLQPKPTSRNSVQRDQRLALLRNGWVPIPCEGKSGIIENWPRVVVDEAQVIAWDGYGPAGSRFKGTGVRIEPPLFVLDLDIKDSDILNAVLAAIEASWPAFFAGALWRHSGAVSLALFSQIDRPVGGRHSTTFASIGEDGTASNKAHIETYGGGTNGKYFAAFGPHAVPGREYDWDGPSPVDTPVSALPVFPADDVGKLHDLVEQVLGQHLSPLQPARAMGSEASVYDLTPDTVFILPDHSTVTAAELESTLEIGAENGVRGTMSEEDYAESDSKERAHAFRRDNGRLLITDFYRDVKHYYADEAPAVVDHEALAAALRGIDETEAEAAGNDNSETPPPPPAEGSVQRHPVIRYDDLIGHSPSGKFIHRATRELWPSATVDKRLPKVKLNALGEDNKPIRMAASTFIMKTAVVEQMSWMPGEGEIIEDTIVLEGGRQFKAGARVFNLYQAPEIVSGDSRQAGRWIDHVRMLYEANDAQRLIRYFAHTAQYPGVKINHALLMGGAPGIGKDTIIAPLRFCVGSWNFAEVRPADLASAFNKWQRAVVLRINEMHDLGDESMFSLYERMKMVTAAPPETLPINEKHLGVYHIPNVVKVIGTTNYLQNGIYLPPEDRRHDVLWSPLKLKDKPSDSYFDSFHSWLENEGNRHVASYLLGLDIRAFNPNAAPPKTDAFWSIVNANRSPTDSGIGDVLAAMSKAIGGPPGIFTVHDLQAQARAANLFEVYEWLLNMKHRRQIPAVLERHGYVEVPNMDTTDRRWFIQGRKETVYRHSDLAYRDAVSAIVTRRVAENKKS